MQYLIYGDIKVKLKKKKRKKQNKILLFILIYLRSLTVHGNRLVSSSSLGILCRRSETLSTFGNNKKRREEKRRKGLGGRV